MSKKPLIGVTVAHVTEELRTFPRFYYVKSIKDAGGNPVLIPPVQSLEEAEEILDFVDGLLLTGGGDIAPSFLGEMPLPGIGPCFPERDLGEILLTQKALQADIPILGICRGIQVLAVAAGGKIYQDISTQYPKAIEHKQTSPREYPWHEINVLDSLLGRIIGDKRIEVNSLHHQAVEKLPEGFIQNAVAPDGIIEGIEKVGAKFCIGVQWHPESLASDIYSRELFKAFVRACENLV